ncbi:hypothetical protein CO709_03105 [Burkholderia thailandensis]|nr:hypothetical protein CO709_03105 [Burkholderia thailandensis]
MHAARGALRYSSDDNRQCGTVRHSAAQRQDEARRRMPRRPCERLLRPVLRHPRDTRRRRTRILPRLRLSL